MKDIIALIDAILDAYDNRDFQPKEGVTHCNQAVNAVAEAMGCLDLRGKTADEILELIRNSKDWSSVPFDKVQDMANGGSFLIAGLTSSQLGEEHGHVVVIRPGKPCFSGKWGKTPRCLNVGKDNFIARAKSGTLVNSPVGINDSFIPLPSIFVWRPSL